MVKVSAGDRHTAFLDSNGNVFSTGNNEQGQLGFASRSIQQTPMLMESYEHKSH